MAIKSIASVKSHFETGDRPTQGEFADLIDTAARVTPIAIASAAEGGKTGLYEILSDGDVTARSLGAFGREFITAAATASAYHAFGISSVQSVFLGAETTASSQSLLGISSHQATFLLSESTASSQSLLGGGVAGIAVFEAVTTASAQNALGTIFTRSFESSEQTVTVDTALDVAHGFGTTPKLVQVILRCASTDSGYATGDEVLYFGANPAAGTDVGASIHMDATNVAIVTGSAITVINVGTKNASSITTTNWRWVVRAWA